jgi:dTDP-4-dehydrorhamnose reductase
MLFCRVLVTGSNGLLGQTLVDLLGRYPEYDVLATARDESLKGRLPSCGYVPMDICDFDAVKNVLRDFAPDVVVNCAAMTAVDRCETERDECWQANVDAVEHLARRCNESGTRLVQLSTDFVFNGDSGPYREDDVPEPVNFYGKSKLAAENAVRRAGLDSWTVVRTVLVYGTAPELSRSNIALWVIDQLSSGKRIRVVSDQKRTPTYVKDLARGIEKTIRYAKGGVYHVSGRELVTVHEFALHIADAFDLDRSLIDEATSIEIGQPAPRPPHTGFIILKAETELGYHPSPMQAALADLRVSMGYPQPA